SFFRELEVPLHQENAAAAELFDLRHTQKVLTEFGRAYERLDAVPTPDQARFLNRVAQGLAAEGKVIPVRLALFVEMVRSKPWTT
ncbi:hypothetical protein, partial [Salmonella sp. SAL4447]|uniref:hypothetical protein n=1 Tax=Salmonella sp. SAL4447 TaxID=3159902 RepID=UPI00397C594C